MLPHARRGKQLSLGRCSFPDRLPYGHALPGSPGRSTDQLPTAANLPCCALPVTQHPPHPLRVVRAQGRARAGKQTRVQRQSRPGDYACTCLLPSGARHLQCCQQCRLCDNASNNAGGHYDNATAGDNAEREHRNDRGWEPCDNANQVTMPQARSRSNLAPAHTMLLARA